MIKYLLSIFDVGVKLPKHESWHDTLPEALDALAAATHESETRAVLRKSLPETIVTFTLVTRSSILSTVTIDIRKV